MVQLGLLHPIGVRCCLVVSFDLGRRKRVIDKPSQLRPSKLMIWTSDTVSA